MLTELLARRPRPRPAIERPRRGGGRPLRRACLSDARADGPVPVAGSSTSPAAAARSTRPERAGPGLHGERACSTRVPAPTTARHSAAQLDDHAIRLQFEADRDRRPGELRTLTATREHAFELLRLALTEPRFDAEPVERVRSQILADLRRRESDPDYLASRGWFSAAFPDHPYGRPTPRRRREHRRDQCRRLPRLRRPPARARPAAGRRCRRHHGRGAGAVARRRLWRPACERDRCRNCQR